MKTDIRNREDIRLLMERFYDKLLTDKSISYLFTDVAKINLEEHFPVLVDFWDSILFQSDTYQKNAMKPHLDLHQQSPLEARHFKTWLGYFTATVDELFEGDKAELARQRATSIATIMQIKMIEIKNKI
ncbi:group III truncated hemoglobin [Lacibacter luteus]|uniref:Group III truncated hemoglobin n=1 Tax=Lacibacter luteus TaxID=2508719 RepID=A0A4Q1CKP2_9BACT|nr:group III truncated hemoglobin [Lacibacter luteus]RXK60954.1 group III truncated hemoglobin [Lacibacter luteus]